MPTIQKCPDFARILREQPPDDALKEQLAACFYEELNRMARRRCRSSAEAEDAAHDGLIQALEALGTFRGEAPITAWLRTVVGSACSRLQRGRRNDPALHRPFDDEGPAAPAEEALQELLTLAQERIALVQQALSQVEEPNRTLFLSHETEGMPLEELASRFGLTVESVKARLKRTRAHLREALVTLAESDA
jgi:RNA polymerase sigma-70 factor, ECF subfamily